MMIRGALFLINTLFTVSQVRAGGGAPGGDCIIFDGAIDYAVTGNSMSFSEDRNNCNQKAFSSANLILPPGVTVQKAYLQWSGSSHTVDSQVTFNGFRVNAARTFTDNAAGWDIRFFGAYADVTDIVKAAGATTYTVSDLQWSSHGDYCFANSAYGAWSLVVVYGGPTLEPDCRIHVCQDKFDFTFPAGTYSTTIGSIDPSDVCPLEAEITLVTFESDNYKGERFFIGNKFFGDNLFRGTTAPNLDILTFDIDGIITGGTSSLTYKFDTYLTNTVFGNAIEGLFDFVKVVKYKNSKCRIATPAPTSAPITPPQCPDFTRAILWDADKNKFIRALKPDKVNIVDLCEVGTKLTIKATNECTKIFGGKVFFKLRDRITKLNLEKLTDGKFPFFFGRFGRNPIKTLSEPGKYNLFVQPTPGEDKRYMINVVKAC